ncbi:uncharacterized protein LOC112045749 [Bicyclus anynana]|uniref:Uncharacterized protein LOC112045749 n=1 Tax=Bicyclus anynana TaxID=110368 RepID=A0A6J1MQC4_BICAN|nr:uncharacterized protein LOC112045749 [Bicyclus anynana]
MHGSAQLSVDLFQTAAFSKMQCYICVTYLMIIATAHPPKHRETSKSVEKRSIFNDVIQSLRIRSQLPEDINLNDENNIGQNDDSYKYDNEPLQLPSDFEFMPRRNDRIEMPTLKYRFPKSLMLNSSNAKDNKEEVVIYINTPSDFNDVKTTTQKPKKQKRPRPTVDKNKVAIKNTDESESEAEIDTSDIPFVNTMAGQSQIGNRESQTVVKPTVIVNFRGSVMHRESDIKLEKRKSKNDTLMPHNIFNIKQEINLDRAEGQGYMADIKKVPSKVKQNVNVVSNHEKPRIEEDMMMCETASWKAKENKSHTDRKRDVLQILVSI